jgi:hypothetical protein
VEKDDGLPFAANDFDGGPHGAIFEAHSCIWGTKKCPLVGIGSVTRVQGKS